MLEGISYNTVAVDSMPVQNDESANFSKGNVALECNNYTNSENLKTIYHQIFLIVVTPSKE